MSEAAETHEVRLRRLHMRSIRRGIKEMDLILTAFSEDCLAGLGPEQLDLYEDLLAENDQDLLPWVTGQSEFPEKYEYLMGEIRRIAVGLGQRFAEAGGSPDPA